MKKILTIGTRESQLAVWQATLVKDLLAQYGYESRLEYIKSDGDIDLITPLYEIGVQGVFTKTLDAALVNKRIDIAVHSMKDVPIGLAQGIVEAAVLPRASYHDILVVNGEWSMANSELLTDFNSRLTIATGSIRRRAQWLNRYPDHIMENLRGNVNTRLQKVADSNWDGAIFAAAGLERINLRPENAIILDWMLPAPAQGAIMVVCHEEDPFTQQACKYLNDTTTALCTHIERDYLQGLMGGCSTPISALATVEGEQIFFRGNVLSPTGKEKIETEKKCSIADATQLGIVAANEVRAKGAGLII